MEQSREEILTLIHGLEQKYDLVDWKEQGIHIWPLVRIAIFNELTEKKVTSKRNKVAARNGLIVIFHGLKELFFVKKNVKKTFSLFFASQAHRQEVNGVNYNRFADPLMDDFEICTSDIQLLFETSKQNKYTTDNYKGKRLVNLSAVLDLLHLLATFKQKYRPIALNIELKLQQLKELPFDIRKKVSKKLNNQLKHISVYEQFSSWLLRSYKGEQVFFVCYYGLFNMCLISKARKLGIKTVDIQHGVINDKHIAYEFRQLPNGGYNCLPHEFWTWTTYESDSINRWANVSNQHKAYTKGNPWIDAVQQGKIDFGHLPTLIQHESKPIILYSLSNRDDIFPDFLIHTVKHFQGQYSFWFRLHPRQLAFRKEIEEQLKALGIFDLVELERANNLPLPLILSYTRLHITQFSTVVLEAAYFKVPSILFHTLGRTYFEYNPLKEYFYFYQEEDNRSFDKLLKSIVQ
ncbi:MAG: hypothetical protein RLO12_17380 [Fulvivirga sp.]